MANAVLPATVQQQQQASSSSRHTFNSPEILALSHSRSRATRLPDIAFLDALKHRYKVPLSRRQNAAGQESEPSVPDARHAALFLAYMQESDNSKAGLSMVNDEDYEPCPSWDFAFTNSYVLSEELEEIDAKKKTEKGWPFARDPSSTTIKQGDVRGCNCCNGDDEDSWQDECDPAKCGCQKTLEEIDVKIPTELRGKAYYDSEGRLRRHGPLEYNGLCLFECTSACGCSDDCPNRVVQKGRQVPLEIFKTRHCGWGIRSRRALKAGTFITTYKGELLTNGEGEKRTRKYEAILDTTYVFDLDPHLAEDWANVPDMEREMGIVDVEVSEQERRRLSDLWQARPEQQDRYLTIDAGMWGNLSRFFNHSCDPNMGIHYVWTDSVFDVHRPHIAFFLMRDVVEGEELTFSYNSGEAAEGSTADQVREFMDQQDVDSVAVSQLPIGTQSSLGLGHRRGDSTSGTREGGATSLFAKRCRCGAARCRGVMWDLESSSGAGMGTSGGARAMSAGPVATQTAPSGSQPQPQPQPAGSPFQAHPGSPSFAGGQRGPTIHASPNRIRSQPGPWPHQQL